MKKASDIMFGLHRLTGRIIALLFLMWFVTGLVLIYHPYPRLSDRQLYAMQEALPDSLPSPAQIEQAAGGKVKKFAIRQMQQQTLVTVTTADSTFTFSADGQPVKPVTAASAEATARRWVSAPVAKTDTLHKREQWVLYSRYERDLPIYKFYFDDGARHELFVSGTTGEVLQLTDRSQRVWAWLGAIPHKLYLPCIRRDVEVWKYSITVGGLLCLLAALTGVVIGIHALVKFHRSRRRWDSPYRKPWYRTHHIAGLVFGIFVTAWGLSGMMSMQRIPQWMVNSEGKYHFSQKQMWGRKPLPAEAYRLDYRSLQDTFHDLKEVETVHFGSIPAYRIVAGDRELYVDASGSEAKPLDIPREAVENSIRRVHGDDAQFTVELIDEYDNYYLSRSGQESYPLPVYRVIVDDNIGTRYYISPETGHVRYLNRNKMVKKWVFSGLHYLNIKCLVERPVLWTVCVWVLCLGGAAVCFTGCWLGARTLGRKLKRRGGKDNGYS